MKKKIVQIFLTSLIISPFTNTTLTNIKETNKLLIQQKYELSTNINKVDMPYDYKIENILSNATKEKENIHKNKKIKQKFYNGWTTTNLNVREKPNSNSKILNVLQFNSYIKYIKENDNWLKIKYNNSFAYVNKKYISDKECKSAKYQVPSNSGFKSYMPYKAITNKSSKQYKIQSQYAYTGNYGIRQVNGRYCVAIGTAFNAKIGDYADLILSDNNMIPIIVSDIKDNKDTQSNNIVTSSNGCVSEFIVDSQSLDNNAKRFGDISYCKKEWENKVTEIKIYNKNIFD